MLDCLVGRLLVFAAKFDPFGNFWLMQVSSNLMIPLGPHPNLTPFFPHSPRLVGGSRADGLAAGVAIFCDRQGEGER